MPTLYFTPASIDYLTQFILSLAITGYLAWWCLGKREDQNTQGVLLTCVFAVTTVFIGLLFLDAAVLPSPRLMIVYLENTVLGVMLILLLQFAYRFPASFPQHKLESYLVLTLSLLYTLYEALFAIYRFYLIWGQGLVEYRILEADYALVALFVWVPVTFARQAIAADERPIFWFRKLWKSQNLGARCARTFVLVFILLLALSIVVVLDGLSFISSTVYSAFLSLGILSAIWLFVNAYLNFLPENTSFLTKLSGVMLTLLLAVLGLVGWAVSPGYLAVFRPKLTDYQTLRFTPNASGGYDTHPIPLAFETNFGERLPVAYLSNRKIDYAVNFPFSFYGKTYSKVYITSMGALILGESLYRPNLQLDYTDFPGIVPLLVDLRPGNDGWVFARVEPERLIVTWDHLPALSDPNSIYTFQAVLYQNGSFEMTYNGLPDPLTFPVDTQPSDSPWLRGITSGLAAPIERVNDLAQPQQGHAGGLVQDFYLDFRKHLHDFIAPLAWLIVGGSLLIILGIPILVNSNLIKPLNALLKGLGQVEGGDLTVKMPIQYHDEIGTLTASFNKMAAQLRINVAELEQHVAERTQELQIANTQLKTEAHEREITDIQIIQQQRDLAAAREREQLSRELHDGIGQVLGYINVQAQATQILLEKHQSDAAQKNLVELVQAAQDAHNNLRHTILGLRDATPPQRDFYQALHAYLDSFHQAWGIETVFSPLKTKLPTLPTAVEDQLLHIIQEALVNIRKHARAQRVDVIISLQNAEMTLTICDDGQGFNPQLAPGVEQEHFGLSIMRERAAQVEGRVEIHSIPGRGTQVIVSIPIHSDSSPS